VAFARLRQLGGCEKGACSRLKGHPQIGLFAVNLTENA